MSMFLALVPLSLLLACGDKSEGDTATEAEEPAATAPDADGDGIADFIEGEADSDEDGVPDYLDDDSDGDCILDKKERGAAPYVYPVDSDSDGRPDYLDRDSDGNGLDDADEAAGSCESPPDLDGDGVGNWRDLDDDGDGLEDIVEGTIDLDGDRLGNHQDSDSDGDCVPDVVEAPEGRLVDSDRDGRADYVDQDSDGDGLSDLEEAAGSCEPPVDTDGDGQADYIDADIDGDGLSNVVEDRLGTDPRVRDSDGDGFTDGLEDYAGTDPLDVRKGPSGLVVETGPRQVQEVSDIYTLPEYTSDIFVLLDTAYSYSCYHPDLESFIEDLIDHLFEAFEDIAIGFGTYDDYRYATGWASTTGHPFEMQHQVSTDTESVLRAARGQQMIYGGDAYGSAYEALYQAARGPGFDMVCDRVFTTNDDVRPFHQSESDVFSGAVSGTYNERVEGSGTRNGVGFRPGATPIFLLTADNTIRDPDAGHPAPEGSCGAPVGFSGAAGAVNAVNGRVLGINVYEYQHYDDTLLNQLRSIATETNSYIDSDGDGRKDDPAVLYGSWNWPAMEDVVDAVSDLIEDVELELSFEIQDDENSWVTRFYPANETFLVERGESINWGFTLSTSATTSADDQFYHFAIEIEDDGEEFDIIDVWVVIRPETVH